MPRSREIRADGTMKCTYCGDWKPANAFRVYYRDLQGPRYRYSWCRACESEVGSERQRKKKERIPVVPMTCPQCGTAGAQARQTKEALHSIIRRRICQNCGYRWNTVEVDQQRLKRLEEFERTTRVLMEKVSEEG